MRNTETQCMEIMIRLRGLRQALGPHVSHAEIGDRGVLLRNGSLFVERKRDKTEA
jgi:hypothetical protein